MKCCVHEATKVKLMLDIGSGDNPLKEAEGYNLVTLDIRPEVKPDIVADCRRIPKPDNSFDAIYASHMLEHCGRHEMEAVMIEWLRVLKPGGELTVIVPNLEYAAKDILSGLVNQETYDVLYGHQEYEGNAHRMGFTPIVLKELLEIIGGLENIRLGFQMEEKNIIAEAVKSKALSRSPSNEGQKQN